MSSVWLCIPSARPRIEADPVLEKWRRGGYKIALWRDNDELLPLYVDRLIFGPYPGYAKAVNALVKDVLAHDAECDWVVCAGDDTLPDPNHSPEEIARECSAYFGGTPRKATVSLAAGTGTVHLDPVYETFGCMQPTGDRFAHGSIDRIAGSPWIGREFAQRMYGGNGPYFPEYFHMFCDEEIMCVAQNLGVFWQRPDLIHKHNHFMRESDALDSRAVHKLIPVHLIEVNSTAHWNKYQTIFHQRKAQGFPGHEPLLPASERWEGNAPGIIRNLKLDNGDPDTIEVRR